MWPEQTVCLPCGWVQASCGYSLKIPFLPFVKQMCVWVVRTSVLSFIPPTLTESVYFSQRKKMKAASNVQEREPAVAHRRPLMPVDFCQHLLL